MVNVDLEQSNELLKFSIIKELQLNNSVANGY
jgi:hypothetical protein